jgi:hypothetical protein
MHGETKAIAFGLAALMLQMGMFVILVSQFILRIEEK